MTPTGTFDPHTGKVESVQMDERVTADSDDAVVIPEGVSPMPGESPDPLAELLGSEEEEDESAEEPEEAPAEEPEAEASDDEND
jgi:hypothetical protein